MVRRGRTSLTYNEDSDDTEGESKRSRSRAKTKPKKRTPKKSLKRKISKPSVSRKNWKEVSDHEESETDDDSNDTNYDDTESDSDVESYARPSWANKKTPLKLPKKATAKEKEETLPSVSEMVLESIKALKDEQKSGATLGLIKETIALNWPVNMNQYDNKIKTFILKAVAKGDIIQTSGKGTSGRFTVPGIKIPTQKGAKKKEKKSKPKQRKRKRKATEPPDQELDGGEYQPKKTKRDEDREKDAAELERQRQERKAQLELEAERKANQPKKKKPPPPQEWEVEAIKRRKFNSGILYYLVKFKGWNKPQWEPEANVAGCIEIIKEFEMMENKRLAEVAKVKGLQEEGVWEVKKIVDLRTLKSGKREFLVRWVGCRPDEDTWEPEDNLDCPELVEKFLKTYQSVHAVDDKSLRIFRKPVQRLAFASRSARAPTSRHGSFRKTYEGMDD